MAAKKGKQTGKGQPNKAIPAPASHPESSDEEVDAFGKSAGRGPSVFTLASGKNNASSQRDGKNRQAGSGGRRTDGSPASNSTREDAVDSGDEVDAMGKRAAHVYDALRSGSHRTSPTGPATSSGGEEARKRLGKKEKGKNAPRSGKRKEKDEGFSFAVLKERLFESSTPLRSRLLRWLVNACVALAIIGVFALKAAEEYYGQDEDTGGQQTEQHLAALQLDSGATEADIRKAYRTLSVRWHPDKNPGCAGCQARFTEVAVAYESLMKALKKKKDGNDAGDQERSRGEGEESLARTSKDIIDLTSLGPNDAFYPATGRHVWTIMLHNDKDEFSEHVMEMWQETALTLGKYFKYGVINVRKNKDLTKRLPVNIKIFPAILVMANGMHPEVYPAITRPSVESIHAFIARSFPNHIASLSSASEVKAFLSASAAPGLSALAQPYKLVVVPSRSSPTVPSLLLKHAAHKYLPLFSFGYVHNLERFLADEAETKELFAALQDPPRWLTRREDTKSLVKNAPLGFTQEDLRSSLVFLLFVDEGEGVHRYVEKLSIRKSRASQSALFTQLHNLLASFQQHVHPYIYQQNAALLCRGTLEQRVYTLVRVEGPAGEGQGGDSAKATADAVLSVDEISAILQTSRERFLKEEEVAEEDEGSKDGGFHVQTVRLSLDAPALLPSLPGIPASAPFFTFWKEDLEFSRLFLLDLDGSRFLTLHDADTRGGQNGSLREAEAEKKRQRSLLAELYQLLDAQQHKSEDEEIDEKHLDFEPLPEYCDAHRFAKRCVASAAPAWYWSALYSFFDISWTNVVLLASVAALCYVGGGLSSEMVIMLVLGGSLLIGCWSHFETIFNFFSTAGR
ncbi:putative DnaJ domain-containing protein [Neospora caninum Liverpool]|uniref:Putative DnaJ domain-containing protein n=1 Tax=Neospora caninum (strain Liverpool) TaxID=572307 RepID=F0VI57_NEOCL|nr:putative DnaJ domain-containing protein [Neospora caninum Liverpool]CBZ53418.1 putative DnaJ domain-containing protein [Neospora caninum Liverpool]|eukprot:XP_003883450.1 putative DnaJ domain-containing protein [Neospora caninum Liverpool]